MLLLLSSTHFAYINSFILTKILRQVLLVPHVRIILYYLILIGTLQREIHPYFTVKRQT